jgi:hypothetical protein
MGVNAAPRSTQIERVPEQGGARGFLEIERWSSEEDAIAVRSGKGQHEDVGGQDAFFLHARGGYVDLISWGQAYWLAGGLHACGKNSPHSDADASTRTRYPAQVIEATAKLGDEVCGLHRKPRKG